ncbi:MAG: DUF1772 domain-containing protein [Cytophagaceae bacterium]|nr:MAG: DUF1772 domain-containing protein [Cytophagaceae bacterium]
MVTPSIITLLITALASALIAGLLYAYACSVNPGLNRLSDSAYLAAMQSINQAILNPVFFFSFLGTLVLLPVSSWLHYEQPVSLRFWCLLGATLTYAIGVFGVTMFGNVPLNNMLESADLGTLSPSAMSELRTRFELSWNRFHTVRTLAAVLTQILVLIAVLNPRSTT